MPTTFRILNDATGTHEDVVHYYPEESAAHFGLSRRTVIRRIASGRWHGVRIGQTTYMTEADWDHAYLVERELTGRARPTSPPRLGLAIPPDEADKIEGVG